MLKHLFHKLQDWKILNTICLDSEFYQNFTFPKTFKLYLEPEPNAKKKLPYVDRNVSLSETEGHLLICINRKAEEKPVK